MRMAGNSLDVQLNMSSLTIAPTQKQLTCVNDRRAGVSLAPTPIAPPNLVLGACDQHGLELRLTLTDLDGANHLQLNKFNTRL